MKNKISASLILSVLLFVGFAVYAEEATLEKPVACTMDAKVCPDGSFVGRVPPSCEFAKCPGESGMKNLPGKMGEIRNQIRVNNEEKEVNRQEIRKEIDNIKGELQAKKQDYRLQMQNLIDSVKAKRLEFQTKMETDRAQTMSRIAEMKTDFKENLSKIKDERKKISAEKIVTLIVDLNLRLTDQFSDKVDQIENVLVSIESRIAKANENGQDVAEVKAEVEKAKTAIATARESIATQAGKVYEVTVTDQETLKTEMKKLRDTFNSDIKVVREKVKSAHMAVKTTATTLAKIPNVDDEVTSTVEENINNINQ